MPDDDESLVNADGLALGAVGRRLLGRREFHVGETCAAVRQLMQRSRLERPQRDAEKMRFVLLAEYKDGLFEINLVPDAANGLLAYCGSPVFAYKALDATDYEPGYKPSSEQVLRLEYQLPDRLARFDGAVPGRTERLRDDRLRVGLPRALIGDRRAVRRKGDSLCLPSR